MDVIKSDQSWINFWFRLIVKLKMKLERQPYACKENSYKINAKKAMEFHTTLVANNYVLHVSFFNGCSQPVYYDIFMQPKFISQLYSLRMAFQPNVTLFAQLDSFPLKHGNIFDTVFDIAYFIFISVTEAMTVEIICSTHKLER